MNQGKSEAPPLLTIGMPVYNGEQYLHKAIDSLLAQTHVDFELIISDNSSTDGTGAVCREYAEKDSRIRYVRQLNNKGALANFQFVLDEARGGYFMWAAADDEWDKEWVAVLLRQLSQEGVSMAFGHVVNIDQHDNIIKTYKYKPYSNKRIIRLVQLFYRDGSLYGKPNLIYSIYKYDFIRNYEMKVLNKNTIAFDVHFVFNLAQKTEVLTNKNVLLYKRIGTNKIMPNKPSLFRSRIVFLIEIFLHQVTFITIADGFLTKLILAILLPINYCKSIAIRIYQIICYKYTKSLKYSIREGALSADD